MPARVESPTGEARVVGGGGGVGVLHPDQTVAPASGKDCGLEEFTLTPAAADPSAGDTQMFRRLGSLSRRHGVRVAAIGPAP